MWEKISTWMPLTLHSIVIHRIIFFLAMPALDALSLDTRCPFDVWYCDFLPDNFTLASLLGFLLCLHWLYYWRAGQNIDLGLVPRHPASWTIPLIFTAVPNKSFLKILVVLERFTSPVTVFIVVGPEIRVIVNRFYTCRTVSTRMLPR